MDAVSSFTTPPSMDNRPPSATDSSGSGFVPVAAERTSAPASTESSLPAPSAREASDSGSVAPLPSVSFVVPAALPTVTPDGLRAVCARPTCTFAPSRVTFAGISALGSESLQDAASSHDPPAAFVQDVVRVKSRRWSSRVLRSTSADVRARS